MEKATSRILGWNIATSIGYSFIITVLMALVSLIVKAFYPPTSIQIAPIVALILSPALGVIQLIIIGLLIAFTIPIRSVIAQEQLKSVRKIGIYTAIGYLAFSLMPYAFVVPYIQTYIGLIIAFNILNGAMAGSIATL